MNSAICLHYSQVVGHVAQDPQIFAAAGQEPMQDSITDMMKEFCHCDRVRGDHSLPDDGISVVIRKRNQNTITCKS